MTLLIVFLAVLVGFIAFTLYNIFSQLQKRKRNIRTEWGKVPAKKNTIQEFDSISCYFKNIKDKQEAFFIDDITWNDLDMNRVFSRINSTQTSIGEEFMYKMLRELVHDEKTLTNRDKLIEYFRSNAQEREKIQLLLSGMGKFNYLNIADYITGKRSGFGKSGILYKLLSALFFVSPFITALFPPAAVIFFVTIIVNIILYVKSREQILGHLNSLSYMVNMISTAKRLSKVHNSSIAEYTDRLKKTACKVKGVSLSTFFFMVFTTENYLIECIKIFFLGEPIAFHSIFKLIEKYRTEFEETYKILGELDCLIAIASYRDSVEYYTTPILRKSNTYKSIEFEALNHPLIEKPVSNSLNTVQSVLITGSNASGKSTFLKAVAINAILAQTIYTCLAKEYKSCYFNVYSSMALNDNLESNESYYIVEIKSLKRIMKGLSSETPVLCVIDEVLRGTNTIERIAASSEIIDYLSNNNCICICATHDIELAQILGNRIENYHFQEFFEGDKIKFDYKIYTGKSASCNAIRLLKILGFNENIVTNADKRAKSFMRAGIWTPI